MLDPQDEQFDRRLATHLVSLYHQSREEEEGAYLVGHTHLSCSYVISNSNEGSKFASNVFKTYHAPFLPSLSGYGYLAGLRGIHSYLSPPLSVRGGGADPGAGLCR